MAMELFRAGKIRLFTQKVRFLPFLPLLKLLQSLPTHLPLFHRTLHLFPKKASPQKVSRLLLETFKNSLLEVSEGYLELLQYPTLPDLVTPVSLVQGDSPE
jgi:hypothetical protein